MWLWLGRSGRRALLDPDGGARDHQLHPSVLCPSGGRRIVGDRVAQAIACGSDVVRNLMHANDLRLFAMLWHKVFAGSDIPTDNAFYPQVCNRQIQIGRGG